MRFTIRDVLWLMVVVGMGVGWWIDRRYLATGYERDALLNTIRIMRSEIEELRAKDSKWGTHQRPT